MAIKADLCECVHTIALLPLLQLEFNEHYKLSRPFRETKQLQQLEFLVAIVCTQFFVSSRFPSDKMTVFVI
jgi:hypothetical protein